VHATPAAPATGLRGAPHVKVCGVPHM
jgi:hypothetical protein